MTELWRLPATELAYLIRARKVSAVEAAEAALQRLDSVNPRINAIVAHRPERVLAQAENTKETSPPTCRRFCLCRAESVAWRYPWTRKSSRP